MNLKPPSSSGSQSLSDRLRDLKLVMQKMDSKPVITSQPLSALSLNELGGFKSKNDAIIRLMQDIYAKSGIKVGLALEKSLNDVFRHTDLDTLNKWIARLLTLEANHPEWLSLVEMLTVHETYFFRDPGQLDFLRKTAVVPLIEREIKKPVAEVNIWSAACSTGEEAYTMGMIILDVLQEKGEVKISSKGEISINPKWRISILGTDISRAVAQRAQNAVYEDFGLGPFRAMPPRYRAYFDQLQIEEQTNGKHYQVKPELRRLLSFKHFNLMEKTPPSSNFDIVLCRNVLIYFDEDAKLHVMGILNKALRNDGYLAMGPTDSLKEPDKFKPLWGPSTIIFQKR